MNLDDVRSLKDFDLEDKVIYDRVDLNISRSDGKYANTKLKVIVDDCKNIIDKGGKLVLASHIGRDPEDSLKFLVDDLSESLGKKVRFVEDCAGDKVEKKIKQMKPGDVLLLENTRKHPEERQNKKEFAKSLAKPMELGVFDAFPSSHRAHASVTGVMDYIPFCAGPRFIYELKNLEKFREEREDTVCVLGGIKKEKVSAMKMFLEKGYKVIPGGLPLNAVYKAQGIEIGDSIYKEGCEKEVEEVLSKELRENLIIPEKVEIAKKKNYEDKKKIDIEEGVPEGYLIVGSELPEDAYEALDNANRIMVAGPSSLYEKGFYNPMEEISKYLEGKESVLMGADTIEAYNSFDLEKTTKITGGGAGLTFLKEGTNPALEALKKNKKLFS